MDYEACFRLYLAIFMLKVLFIICVFTSIVCNRSFAQVNTDSLWKIFGNNSIPDTARLTALDNIIWGAYLFSNPDTAFVLAELMFKEAHKKKELINYEAAARNIQGVSYGIQGDNPKALVYFQKGLALFKKIGDKKGEASSYGNLGLIYKELGQLDKAIECYNLSLRIDDKMGNQYGIASAYGNIASVHEFEASEYQEKNQQKAAQKEFRLALSYYKKCSEIFTKFKDPQGIANSMGSMAGVYNTMDEVVRAGYYYEKAIPLFEKAGDITGKASALNNYGLMYLHHNDVAKAEAKFREAGQICERVNDVDGMMQSYTNIGNLYSHKGNYPESIKYLLKAHDLLNATGSVIQRKEIAFGLYDTYKHMGNYKEAFNAYNEFLKVRDSVFNENSKREIIRQELKYQYGKKSLADSVKAEGVAHIARANLKREKTLKTGLYIGASVLLLFGIFMFNRLLVARRQRNVIRVQKEESEMQKTIIEEKQREVLDSIQYARRIQQALLPNKKHLDREMQRLKGEKS
jgi:tetratricopeptide (TPR) repeat protein